ncbi:lactaldehyde reductase [Edwardsiella tarda]|uniref:Lactaldehyde reductase n=1 Tax=Edwardsiella tarda ATCC 15947 = NBRC 105688 TaxID=667121 RepID=A0AC61TGV4_EDWTA|nr:lactaldehyde reductase [Edwardsiella tarda]ATI63949.1 lactaldehyde reductase [Edwardsiella tarda]UAL57011.1 lactaldehyde reductase [Edwardsiella tarda]UCP99935.1 lactaldehyde reductase [Edwardsiella tarda ATCC 15947 = NBRC 105688]UCQ11091.1 lactaldehyde reductase [Edwardsiella tarda]UCQ17602.1 lactaldehyde reductase [Edwardsiella tarda]
MAHRMILNETAWFGRGAIAELPGEIQRRGYRKALIVTDRTLVACGAVARVTDHLDRAGLPYALFDGVVPNPTIRVVQQGLTVFRECGADYLIAIGGGSPQDTCKAIGIISNNPAFEDVRSLEGLSPTTRPSVPILAIPTTAGTAAEVTINYVITDEEQRRKFVCVDPHDIPQAAFIDADMMDGMPPALKAATGVDALTHAIEGYLTRGAWALTDALHLKAIELIGGALRDSVRGDAEAGATMALGQYVAGMGFSNVGLGLVHGMAHPLGAFYNTPHGVANAILLPHVMRYNAAACGEKFRDIARALGVACDGLSLEQAQMAAVDAVEALNREVGIPPALREVGVREEDIAQLAAAALADVCTGGNPRSVTLQDIEQLYRQAY